MNGPAIEEGQRLVAGFTGDEYTVTNVEETTVVVRGKRGLLRVDRKELRDNINEGKVAIEEWR